jgi:lipid II:glycine glycyltransferase (peptidoglycan interpeptide bridge formation enzyme)
MLTEVYRKDIEEVFESPIIQQTTFWSRVKQELGVQSMAFNFKGRREDFFDSGNSGGSIVSDLLVVIQSLDRNHSVAYVPYGPELEPEEGSQGPFLEELSECLKSYLPSSCIAIRYDLLWQSYWAGDSDFYDSNGHWTGPPEKAIQEIRFNYGTENWGFKKAFNNILPSNTVFLNLGLSDEQILARMKSKTRYNIRLAFRRGVQVRELSFDQLDIWYQLYRETAVRNRILLHDIEYFRAVLAAPEMHASQAKVKLLVAETDQFPLSAMFLVMSGKRATYLYGASSSHLKSMMGSYAIQWGAITMAKSLGCTEYDMFGIAPNPDPEHPMYGLYRFKTGFGGDIYHSLGSWDYPLDNEKYAYFTAMEMASQGYHV